MEKVQFIQVTPQELQKAIIDGVKSQLDELKKSFQPKEPTDFMTRSEVAELLKINLSTVHNWTKNGTLISYGIGGTRIYYKRKEIESAIIKLNK